MQALCLVPRVLEECVGVVRWGTSEPSRWGLFWKRAFTWGYSGRAPGAVASGSCLGALERSLVLGNLCWGGWCVCEGVIRQGWG